MAGVYIHIPFCHQKCSYCDFYSRGDSYRMDDLIQSELLELSLRSNYINNERINTIYFGGGTPSLLSIAQLNKLLTGVRDNFDVSSDCEITFEANPDDLSDEYLVQLYSTGINRLSIGMQSFNNKVLKFLGRRHDSHRLVKIIEFAKGVGFNNISVDLIFGIPNMDFNVYLNSLEQVISLDIQHVSAYSLSIEKETYLYKILKRGDFIEVGEEEMFRQYNTTIDVLSSNGFLQYEISNYAKGGFKSQHNTSYWNNIGYIGIGPSAHSYNGVSRQWNISDTSLYCANINSSRPFFESEILSLNDKYNEYLITGLRTSDGISIDYINENFDQKIRIHFDREVNALLKGDTVVVLDKKITLSRSGMFISDFILRNLCFT